MARGTEARVTMVVDTKKPVKNINELTKKIQDMRTEIEGREIGSERFNELSAAIAKASGELKTLEMNMEGLDAQQKAEGFVKLGEGIAGGFAVGQGAMALFGTESEALQELQTRVQGAIAIAMGVRMMSEAALQIAIVKRTIAEKANMLMTGKGRLATIAQTVVNFALTGSLGAVTVAKGSATAAAIALRIAMMAIPLLAVIGGVTALVGALSSWFSQNEQNVDSQLRMNAATIKSNDEFLKQLDYKNKLADAKTDEEKQLVRLQELMRKEREDLDYNNKALEKNATQLKEINDYNDESQVIIKNNTKILNSNSKVIQGNIEYYNQLIREQQQLIEDKAAAEEAEKERLREEERERERSRQRYIKRQNEKKQQEKDLRKLEEEIHLLGMKDEDEREKQKIEYARQDALRKAESIRDEELKQKTIQAIKDKYDQLELNRLDKIQKEKDAKDQAEIDRIQEENEKLQEELRNNINEEIRKIEDIKAGERETELREAREHFQRLLASADLTQDERDQLEEEHRRQRKEINDRFDQEEIDAEKEKLQAKIDAHLEALGSTLDAIMSNMDARMAEIDQATARELEMEGLTEKQKQNIQEKADAKKKKIDARRKKVAAAMAIIDTYKAATSAYSSLAPIPFVGPVLGGIAAGAAIAAGLANVRQIYAQDVGGGSGGGGGGSAVTPKTDAQPPATTGAFTLGGADPNKKPVKAYVVTDEMTDSQEQLEGIREQSTI